MNQNHNQTAREEILMEFVLSDREPLNDRLAEFIATYPQYAASFARLAQELQDFDSAPLGELTTSEISEQQIALQVAIEALGAPADPFEAATPNQLRELAAHLRANSLFITRLKDRVIDVTDMTEGFLACLASFFSAPVERIRASLAQPHRIAAGTAFKAKGKPEAAGKQSFDEALRSSGLSQEQQDHLRSL